MNALCDTPRNEESQETKGRKYWIKAWEVIKENQTVLNYMCAHFNRIEIQIVEIIASRASVFALSSPEMMKLREVCGEPKMRGERASKREDDGANLYLLPKWWPNVMELKKKAILCVIRSLTLPLVAFPLVGVDSTAGASRHPWLYRLSTWFNVN